MNRLLVSTCVSLICTLSGAALAQGVQTGTIRGTVRDQQALAVPGVTVTVASPALQGTRIVVTDSQGDYTVPALPPGDYVVTYELSGFATFKRTATLPLGLTLEENVALRPAAVNESIDVVGDKPAPIATPVVGLNIKHDDVDALANSRTIVGIATLSAGLSEAAPNPNALAISGGFSFDNSIMINGVDVVDNVFATPQNLFIEDAIEETQVLTSGISVEYGRFGGGVINAVTKSGGNTLAGTGRLNLSNPSWITATPFEASRGIAGSSHPTDVQRIYEGTLGGPVAKDRLWFFSAGRYQAIDNPVALQVTGASLSSTDENKRGEIKLTGTLAPNHTLQGGYLNDPRTRTNNSGVQSLIIDPHSEVTRQTPNWYYFTNYRGIVRNDMLVEAAYSERRFRFSGDGGTSATSGFNVTQADLIANSPFVGTCYCTIYNAPYLDAGDPEGRNNRQVTGSVLKYWNSRGRHETKSGYEFFRSQRTGGASQSPTSYVFGADFATDPTGAPVFDATGRPIPVFVPGQTYLSYFPAAKGAAINNDSNSLYLQDHWTINSRWSADLGARYEHVKIASTGNVVSVDANRIVPRFAVAFDPQGNGRQVIHATYGQYSSRYNEGALGKNSVVANPPEIDINYVGPAGQGYNFAPGFDLANYPINAGNASVSDPTQNVKVAPDLKSPLTHEVTLGYGTTVMNGRGYGEVTYVGRTTHDLIEDFQDLSTGTTDVVVSGVSAGTFTNILYKNTNLAHRQYQAMVFQSRYSMSRNWSVNGNYTLQLKNDGNYEGEGTNTPGLISFMGNFPQAFNAASNYPDGHLAEFQRSRLRVWSVYNWDLKSKGDLSISGLWRVDSGLTYSLVARNQSITSTQKAILDAAGYPDIPAASNNEVFYSARGSESFKGFGLFDTSVTYNVPVFRSLRPWVKLDLFNVFNNEKLIAWNTTISQDKTTVDALGLGTTYTKSATFGTATGNTVTNLYNSAINAFPVAFNGAQPGGRTFRMAVGVRF